MQGVCSKNKSSASDAINSFFLMTALTKVIPWEIDGETVETVSDVILGALQSLQMVIAAMILKDTYSLEGNL